MIDLNASSQRSLSDRLVVFASYGIALLIALICVLPFVYALSVALRPPQELFADSLYLIPKEPTFEAVTTAFNRLQESLVNSIIISTGTMILSLIIVIPSAYVFGRLDFKGKRTVFYAVLLIIMFPFILLIIPISETWHRLGLWNTIPGLWISYQIFVAPFAIWILRDYFAKLPMNLEESAQIYGCSPFTAFVRVILPLAAPAIVAVAFLAFLTAWNDFLMSSMLTTGTGPRPAVVDLYLTIHGTDASTSWALILSETLIVGTPPTVLYLLSRKSLSKSFEMSD
ncbi:carbohydrate ABC transporter permease [Natronorubrum halophilum]|uniref:carbohydrate ABC transporter permease n=1 Tax=Natronorubrum halophilum TaxID=1702106 RepID=UPI0010C22B86|nr:carbohydrate ABC transporter permease [Natronorubrum halophilum]